MIELLVYMALFTLLTNMVYLAFRSANSLNRRADAHLTDLQNVMFALDDIRGAAFSAVGVAKTCGEYKADGQTLIIVTPGEKRYVYTLENGYIQRLTLHGEGAQDEDVQTTRFPVKCESLTFQYDADRPSDARLISIALRLKKRKRVGELGGAFSTKVLLRNAGTSRLGRR